MAGGSGNLGAMTATKTATSKKDRDELAKELARRKANPMKVEKPVRGRVIRERDACASFNGVTAPALTGAVPVTK